jgi:hypothetical protein
MEQTQKKAPSPGEDPPKSRCSMTHPSGKDYYARAAIALNNTGVALLERGAHQLAVQTFENSIAVLKRELDINSGLSESNDGFVRRKLELAETRLASTFKPTFAPNPQSTVCIRRFSFDGCSFNDLKFDLEQVLSKNMYMPASIDPSGVPCLNEDSAHDIDFQFAVIIYNFALAHLCLAQTAPSASSRSTRATFVNQVLPARQLLQMVLEILTIPTEPSSWSMWTEGSRLALACISLAHRDAGTPDASRSSETGHASHELSLAVDAWHYWVSRTGHWIDDETAVVLVEAATGVNESSLQLHIRQRKNKAPAA